MSSTPLLPRVASGSPFLWRAGALITAAAIGFGAFGAHGLKQRKDITPDRIAAWNTAAHYAILNGLGLLLVSLHPRFSVHRFAGPAIMTGTIFFSGSIFALTLNRDLKFLGPITPMGGLMMIAGYISLAL
ncbi:hypothetical protein EV361DRAFT_896287 [Lentinula raphanica]|uniref:DUF423-domain-containing protein n=1 Tax=Lentinula raphanica TaxID=153919 RepID=A0AA38UFK3_9AGAR|nr:DUF423-domain-containing protein [Lentinula raphanica]KAJ3757366.1 hypothetical protein EV360DRAFT_84099 [Lentinula raphanica]KAJ3777995.1 hypothetical protein FB446DRAFT_715208 [Lentinula raphanica]KAJ3823067.1 hypothetical protein F5880DRAFT_1569856 [Lentinula raphanica]KAJ3839967.1 hypothetical protein F5878DRAFT_716785 [Lentinula raphanica]